MRRCGAQLSRQRSTMFPKLDCGVSFRRYTLLRNLYVRGMVVILPIMFATVLRCQILEPNVIRGRCRGGSLTPQRCLYNSSHADDAQEVPTGVVSSSQRASHEIGGLRSDGVDHRSTGHSNVVDQPLISPLLIANSQGRQSVGVDIDFTAAA
jgi:hypothetical protein